MPSQNLLMFSVLLLPYCYIYYSYTLYLSGAQMSLAIRCCGLADSIHNILIFFAEKNVNALHCKSYSHFFNKKFQHICVSFEVNFNESLTNDVVSFEQLGPDF